MCASNVGETFWHGLVIPDAGTVSRTFTASLWDRVETVCASNVGETLWQSLVIPDGSTISLDVHSMHKVLFIAVADGP